jgi:putative glutamine amidotransferase
VSEPGVNPLHSTPQEKASRRWLPLVDRIVAPLIVLVRWLGATKRNPEDPARDRLEMHLLDAADRKGLPVLGICRGAQLMNVFAKGSLLRDLDRLYRERPRLQTVLPRRPVDIEDRSCLRMLVGQARIMVNSLHRHAVDEPGRGLRIVAREPSGVVQAIENSDRPLWIGVQWHPEYLPQMVSQRALFRTLVAVAARRGADRPGRCAQAA